MEEDEPNGIETSESPQSVHPILTEIIVEILSRLPVESLLRCRSVCKLWLSLISNPHFIKSHLSLSTRKNHYAHHDLVFSTRRRTIFKTCDIYDALYDNSVEPKKLGCPFKWSGNLARIVGSCNGLLCIVTEDDCLFIWNPSTRKVNWIPYEKMWHFWTVRYGFGYEESSDDYKVVEIVVRFIERYKYQTFTKIYSLRNGSWKSIDAFPDGMPLDYSGKFSNGALHWATNKNIGCDFSASCSDEVVMLSFDWRIICLDLATERYGEVVQPVYDKGYGYGDLTLGSLRDWLCVLCSYRGTRVDLWVMKVYGVKDSWTKLVSVPFLADPQTVRYSVPLCISNDGKVLLQLFSKLIVYDSKDGSFSENRNFECAQASTFVESLVSPMPVARLG